MYNRDIGNGMKRRNLEKKLSELGWHFDRHGGNHDVWTNGKIKNFIPKHSEIAENLAKEIVKMAQQNRGKKEDM